MTELAVTTETPAQAVRPTRAPIRDSFNHFFVAHEVAWELAMAALAVAYVAIGFIGDDELSASERAAVSPEIALAELVLTAIFVLEFGSRILAARNRSAYLRGHWIDLVTLAPPIRGARVLRLLRLLRLVRAFSGIYRAGLHVQALARHRGFAWLLVAWLGVMVLCSAWMYVAEHGLNKAIDSPFDALWWGVVTLTTVGYGDVYPQTPEGRVAAMVLMLLGIVLFGAITATITSYLMTRDLRGVEAKVDADIVLDQTIDRTTRTSAAAAKTTAAAERTSSASGTLVSDLERLAELHREGGLTATEFARAKKVCLDRSVIDYQSPQVHDDRKSIRSST
jgi:voltage-gated potassium channel